MRIKKLQNQMRQVNCIKSTHAIYDLRIATITYQPYICIY